jgi:hypothetical protein
MASLTEVGRTALIQHTFPVPSQSRGSICLPCPTKIPCSDPIFPALAIGSLEVVVQKEWRMLEGCLSRTPPKDLKKVRVGAQRSKVLPLGGSEPRASSKALQMPLCGCSWQNCWRGVDLRSRNVSVDVEID